MAARPGWRDGEPVPTRPEPETIEERAELLALARKRRAARARTLQLVEWLGMAAIVLGVVILAGPAWALVAAGAALIVIANAS